MWPQYLTLFHVNSQSIKYSKMTGETPEVRSDKRRRKRRKRRKIMENHAKSWKEKERKREKK